MSRSHGKKCKQMMECPASVMNTFIQHESIDKKDGYRQLNVRQLGSLRPWDNRGKCHMDRKRIQCWSNASQHVPIYLQPFLRYSKLLVENCDIFTANIHSALISGPAQGDPVGISRIYPKLEWMGYRVVKKAWQYFQPFWYSASVWRTDRRTDRWTEKLTHRQIYRSWHIARSVYWRLG